MKIVLTGATGFIGRRLCRALAADGHELVALTRDPVSAQATVPELGAAHPWHAVREYAPREALEGADAVVHLAGESVAGRWTAAKKELIYETRALGTKHLVEVIAKLDRKPRVLVSASAIGYYGDRGEEKLSETSEPGDDFLARVCRDWEAQAMRAEEAGVRVVRPRIGIVLGPGGGALDAMLLPFKLGAGGPLGSGQQWWSWVHRDDVVGLIRHALAGELDGPVNATAPEPVRQRDFAKALGRVLKRPAFLPAPALALKLVLGEFSSELLGSKRVVPERAQQSGYAFAHPELEAALRDCLKRG